MVVVDEVVEEYLSTAQQNTVSITVDRHSGNLLAGIHKSLLDTG